MNIIGSIKKRLSCHPVAPLIYDNAMRTAYSTTSVTGGNLKGKTAVITGATSGIGYATAQRFLQEGCNVIITGRDEGKIQKSISTLIVDKEIVLSHMVIDSLDPLSLNKKVNKIFDNNKIDIWINCAGIFKKTDRERRFRNIDANTYFDVVNTNLKSNMLLVPYVADKMIEHMIDGTIINVSSICGYTNHFGHTPYGISKNGLIEYTKEIAEKYNNKVSIISVAPGSVATKMGDTGFGKNISSLSSFTHHISIPEETASVIAFLSSPIRKHLNGQTIIASAGEQV